MEGSTDTEWENLYQTAEMTIVHVLNDDSRALYFYLRNTTPLRLYESDSSFGASPGAYIDNCKIKGKLIVEGAKSRQAKTRNYDDRLLYCYETPTPLFGDIGEARLDEEGICYVDIDDIFTETIAEQVEYQVFLQKEGEGDCWIAEKTPRYFIIQGTPNLKVAWEVKAKQKDYETYRLEPSDRNLDEYEKVTDPLEDAENFIEEQEAILYG